MGRPLVDRRGQKQYNLTFIEPVYAGKEYEDYGRPAWKVQCDCGLIYTIRGTAAPYAKSCINCRPKNVGLKLRTHGMKGTKIYKLWDSMMGRCHRPSSKNKAGYGAKGIIVCDEWRTFEGFYAWALANGYEDGLSIERNKLDGNYCPDNCKWIPLGAQSLNKSNTHWVEWEGKVISVVEAWRQSNNDIAYSTMLQRIKKGWSPIDALTKEKGPP